MEKKSDERKIEIIESFSLGKINEFENEDGLFISEDFVVVVDGVSSKTDFLHDSKKTGRLAMELTLAALENVSPDADIHQIISAINSEYRTFYDKVPFPYSKEMYGLQAMAAIYSKHFHTVWLIGDCLALIDDVFYENPKKSDLILSDMRSLINQIFLSSTEESSNSNLDKGRIEILPWIEKATIFMNNDQTEFGYSVLNGQEIPQSLIRTIKIPENITEIVLSSDGYPLLKDSLEETENNLERILIEDPTLIKEFKSTKGLVNGQNSFDDRTYVKFSLITK